MDPDTWSRGTRGVALLVECRPVSQTETTAARQALRRRFRAIDLYPVTCEALSAGRRDADVLEAAIAGGARIIQLRDKQAGTGKLYEKAKYFRARTREKGLLLIINDHVDIAMAVDADGVHLGQDDLPLSAARALLPDKLIGASTHNLAEAEAAAAGTADYINIGPIFPTGTKEGVSTFLGPDAITHIGGRVRVPFTVMGGINADNLDTVLAAGARRIAVVTAVTQAPDMVAAVRELRQRIRDAGPAPVDGRFDRVPGS
jgi:thiamine-phosphate pyrophosphorylase